jgi:hypothetical protein
MRLSRHSTRRKYLLTLAPIIAVLAIPQHVNLASKSVPHPADPASIKANLLMHNKSIPPKRPPRLKGS